MPTILHIDFNSYFATVEQQANPRLRGKPIGVTGGDRLQRTVLGAASVEAKRFGVKTGMQIWQALKLCPNLILVKGDSDKYLECTKRFLSILKDYSPYVEVFSIDECFVQIKSESSENQNNQKISVPVNQKSLPVFRSSGLSEPLKTALNIKHRIRSEVGEWITCSIGVSYNKLMAKLAGSLYKPDGLVVIENEEAAQFILDTIELDEICGIGPRIKKRLNNMGIFNFKQLREAPLKALLASFKSYGQVLYNMARGIDHSVLTPFYEKEEVKAIGHRHTINHDTCNPEEIKQILLKLTELIARRLRAKKLTGKTIYCYFRQSFNSNSHMESGNVFFGDGRQITIPYTNNGLEIFKAAWKIFNQIWLRESIRMIGVSISNLKPAIPQNMSLLANANRQEIILKTLDKINDKYGEFTLQRGILLDSIKVTRKPNPFLSDRHFKL